MIMQTTEVEIYRGQDIAVDCGRDRHMTGKYIAESVEDGCIEMEAENGILFHVRVSDIERIRSLIDFEKYCGRPVMLHTRYGACIGFLAGRIRVSFFEDDLVLIIESKQFLIPVWEVDAIDEI